MNDLLTIMRALADPTRLRIVFLVLRLELSVGELVVVLGQSQPRVSRHIRILSEAGILDRRKEGNWVFIRPGPVLAGGRLDALLSATDVSTAKTYERDLSRLDEVRTARTETAAAYFAAHAAEWDSLRSMHVSELEVEQTTARLLLRKPIGAVLDIGTGTGRMMELFAAHSRTFVAMDNSSEMLRLARAKLARLDASIAPKVSFAMGDFNALPFEAEMFDSVIFHQVLHYALSPESVIAEAARVLAPSGRIIIVDFAAHDFEELRAMHAHARLGFDEDLIARAFEGNELQMAEQATLEGGKLAVKIWVGQKHETARIAQRTNLRIAG